MKRLKMNYFNIEKFIKISPLKKYRKNGSIKGSSGICVKIICKLFAVLKTSTT